MYPIDFTACTCRDLILRSVTCHPSLLIERLKDIAAMHARYSLASHDATASRIAKRMGVAAMSAASSLYRDADTATPTPRPMSS